MSKAQRLRLTPRTSHSRISLSPILGRDINIKFFFRLSIILDYILKLVKWYCTSYKNNIIINILIQITRFIFSYKWFSSFFHAVYVIKNNLIRFLFLSFVMCVQKSNVTLWSFARNNNKPTIEDMFSFLLS